MTSETFSIIGSVVIVGSIMVASVVGIYKDIRQRANFREIIQDYFDRDDKKHLVPELCDIQYSSAPIDATFNVKRSISLIVHNEKPFEDVKGHLTDHLRKEMGGVRMNPVRVVEANPFKV